MKHAIIRVAAILTLSATVILGGCHKSQVASTVPQPPPPAVPTASLTASPQAIDKGQSTTLSWETTNANHVSIEADGISTETLGAVEAHGSMQVTPGDSTTYKLYANGPGGTQTASARVTVSVPLPPQPAVSGPNEDELFGHNVKDVYFNLDRFEIRPDQQTTIQRDAAFLTEHPNLTFAVEGHCDERGSIEYNLALGDKRANAVKEMLVAAGVSSANVKTISFGKEKPICQEHDESCWQQNRRGHFSR
jgi:peptidoglycan-associated lipoprotein